MVEHRYTTTSATVSPIHEEHHDPGRPPEPALPRSATALAETHQTATGDGVAAGTVYGRCGGYDGFLAVARDILTLHHANPMLEPRYGHAKKSDEELAKLGAELSSSVTGGSEAYPGMDMKTCTPA